MAKQIATDLKVEGSQGLFSAAASLSINKNTKSTIKTCRYDSVTVANQYFVSSSNLENTPSDFVTDDFKNIIKDQSGEELYKRIGTFQASSCNLGGCIRTTICKEMSKTDNEDIVKTELEGDQGVGL